MSAPSPSLKDGQQVLRYAFDDATGKLRVDAVISPDGHDLEIHYADDSIAIGDPTTDTIMTVNPDGSTNTRVSNALVTVPFDYVGLINTAIAGQTVPTTAVYKMGGASGTVVATLTITYDVNANLTSVTKS